LFEHVKHATQLATPALGPNLHAYLLGLESGKADLDQQRIAARAHHEGLIARRGTPATKVARWFDRLAASHLASPDGRLIHAGLEMVRDLKLGGMFAAAKPFAEKSSKHPHLRSLAFDALAAADPAQAIPLLTRMLTDVGESLELRLRAADKLAENAHLPESQRTLLERLPTAPRQLAVPMARGLARYDASAAAFAKLLEDRKASPYLLQDPEVRTQLRDRKIPGLDKRIDAWVKELPSEDETLARLMEDRRRDFHAQPVDAKAGEAIFVKHCGACHQVANRGGKVGPQLDGVGVRGLERLLEDTLAPNRNVDHNFRAVQLVLDDGRALTGLALREEGAAVVFADAQGKEQRIDRARIQTRKTLPTSPMPNDVASRLPSAEFRNLMAYLLAQRQAPAGK
jgi:putative heme-binding domain-containing protein